jgi:hypothetical protein
MTLRDNLRARAEFVAGTLELAMFLLAHPELDAAEFGPLRLVFPVKSKAQADEIIAAHKARPMWRNGYYMAEWNPPKAPPGFLSSLMPPGAPACKAATIELHFAPLITEQDAA